MRLVITPFIIITAIIITSCGGHKNSPFEKDGTLVFKKATYANWVAGIKGGGAGYSINLLLDPAYADYKLDSIYFKDFSASLISNEAGLFLGHIDNGKNKEVTSLIYGRSAQTKETPKQDTVTPFELVGDEAVVSYSRNGIIKYYKFTLTFNATAPLPR